MKITAVFPWDDWTLVGALVVVGLLIVFLILAVLICVFVLVGKIVGVIEKSADKRAEDEAERDALFWGGVSVLPPAIVAQPHPPAVLSQGQTQFSGIGGETVAAITAAIAMYGGGSVVGIRRSRDDGGYHNGRAVGGRTRWGQAGVYGSLK